MVFGLGKQTVNGFFENVNFELILFSEFQNFGEANASPVPRPLSIFKSFFEFRIWMPNAHYTRM